MLERFFVPEEDRIYVDQQQMRTAAEAIFRKMGLTDDDAVLSADVLMLSDLRGCESHGVSNMLSSYIEQYAAGNINPRPNVRVIRESDTTATLDCDTGLGLHVAPKAMEMAIEKADKHGMGTVIMNNGRHLGMLAYHAMLPIKHDMIGVCMTAGNPMSMLPTFGAEKRFSTNPWAWAAPSNKQPPFVMDFATTQVAGNKLRLAARVGAPMAPGWIAKPDGTPIMEETPLPANRDDYHMLPFGGTRDQGSHKGYGFAAVCEILCDVLSGQGAGFLMPQAPPGVMGHFVQVYKVDAFTDVERFKSDMDDFLEGLANTKPAPGHDRVVYPGLPEAEETEIRLRDGIPYHRSVIEWFHSISNELDLGLELPSA